MDDKQTVLVSCAQKTSFVWLADCESKSRLFSGSLHGRIGLKIAVYFNIYKLDVFVWPWSGFGFGVFFSFWIFPSLQNTSCLQNGSLFRYQCRYQYTEGSSALKLLTVALKFILMWMWKACNSITEILSMTHKLKDYTTCFTAAKLLCNRAPLTGSAANPLLCNTASCVIASVSFITTKICGVLECCGPQMVGVFLSHVRGWRGSWGQLKLCYAWEAF